MMHLIDTTEGDTRRVEKEPEIPFCENCKCDAIKVCVPVCDHNPHGDETAGGHPDVGEGPNSCADACHPAEMELYEFYRLNGLGARPCDQIVRCAECESIIQ